MIYTMALLLRSRLESNRSRTVERSVLQLQALVDQFPLEESPVSERLLYFFCIDIPAKWEMEVRFRVFVKLQIELVMNDFSFKLFHCRRFVCNLRCPIQRFLISLFATLWRNHSTSKARYVVTLCF